MQMIPDTPHATGSKAEQRIYDKLRAISFANDTDSNEDRYTAFHSFNLTRHQYKRFGEIDFLITGPAGIFVIEVKGGRVGCHDGVWSFSDRFGNVRQSVEGPFKQAESALHGLMNNVRNHLSSRIVDQFHIGFGVITPDQQWSIEGAEWDSCTLADSRRYKDISGWLHGLFQYWRDKDGKQRVVDDEALLAVNQYLRPSFATVVPLYVFASRVEERVVQLTDDQMVMVDVVRANQRVLCYGGAGTGKTLLAMELARRWTASGMNVIMVCHSPWLKNFLEAHFSIANCTIAVIDGLDITCRRIGVERYDALIVDEGQDLFDMTSLEMLKQKLKGGLAKGRWCFFHDMNNQARLRGRFDNRAFAWLNSLASADVPLQTNCRNTQLILEKVKATLGADMGVRGAGMGSAIREHYSNGDSGKILAQEIEELVEQGGLVPGNVTILSPVNFALSCASSLPQGIQKKITVLDEYAVRSFPVPQISFARISDFKGLENEAVIIIDLPCPTKDKDNYAAHYVAMSRPRAVLSLIYQHKR